MVDARFLGYVAGTGTCIAFLMKDLAGSSFDSFFTIHCSLFTYSGAKVHQIFGLTKWLI